MNLSAFRFVQSITNCSDHCFFASVGNARQVQPRQWLGLMGPFVGNREGGGSGYFPQMNFSWGERALFKGR